MSLKDIFKSRKKQADKSNKAKEDKKLQKEVSNKKETKISEQKETKKATKASKTRTVLGVRVKIDPDKENGGVYYLSPHGEKGWKIMKQGGSKPLFVYDTKAEAMKKARELGRETKSAVIVKGKDGKIKESLNYKD